MARRKVGKKEGADHYPILATSILLFPRQSSF